MVISLIFNILTVSTKNQSGMDKTATTGDPDQINWVFKNSLPCIFSHELVTCNCYVKGAKLHFRSTAAFSKICISNTFYNFSTFPDCYDSFQRTCKLNNSELHFPKLFRKRYK